MFFDIVDNKTDVTTTAVIDTFKRNNVVVEIAVAHTVL